MEMKMIEINLKVLPGTEGVTQIIHLMFLFYSCALHCSVTLNKKDLQEMSQLLPFFANTELMLAPREYYCRLSGWDLIIFTFL